MKKQLIFILTIFIGVSSYAQHDHAGMDHSKMKMDEVRQHEVDVEFSDQLNEVFITSLDLTESFITGKPTDVSSKAQLVSNSLSKVDMKLLKASEAHMDWMMYLKEMNDAINTISSSSDPKIQKESYALFNLTFYKSIKAFGVGNEAFYQFCPMALDNKGAYWLSASEEIRNPYFGESMLKCGSTKEVIR